jgi:hypothetical protein
MAFSIVSERDISQVHCAARHQKAAAATSLVRCGADDGMLAEIVRVINGPDGNRLFHYLE